MIYLGFFLLELCHGTELIVYRLHHTDTYAAQSTITESESNLGSVKRNSKVYLHFMCKCESDNIKSAYTGLNTDSDRGPSVLKLNGADFF